MNTIGKWIIIAAAFMIVFVLGFLLSRSGKPYPMAALTLHKLVSLAILIFLVVTILREARINGLSPLLLTAVLLTAVFFLAAIATGGMLSMEKPMPEFVTILHRWLPWLALLSTGAAAFLLLRG